MLSIWRMKAIAFRSGALLLGAVGTYLALESLGIVDALERTTVIELVREGWLGALAVPLSIVMACAVTTTRSPVRAGLALGFLSMSALPMWWELRWHPSTVAWWCAVAISCAAVALCAVRRSSEPAAARILGTSIAVGALLLGSTATMLWWPQHFSTAGLGPRVTPTLHVAIAAALLVATLVDLVSRRTRALLWLSGAAVALALAPHLAAVQRGCMATPGPLEHLVGPRLVAPIALLLWVGPAHRLLRRCSP